MYEARQTIPSTGIRSSRGRISVSPDIGGGPGARAEASKVPTGVEPDEPSAPEYNPIIDAETMSPPVDPNRQETITNQARMPRFSVGNPNVGNIDLGSLLSSRANPNYDATAPVGGENVPYQGTSGVGGFFRRMFGDTANEQNVVAQQQQKSEWKAEDALAKARQSKIEDYRTQKGIDKEIEDSRDDKRNQQAITMFDKAQNAQKEILKLQQDFTKTQSADERANILERIQSQHTNAIDLQTRALAASEKNQGLQQAFQTRMANFNAQLDDYANKNKITSIGQGFFSRGGELYSATPGSPGFGNMPGTQPTISEPLFGPSAQGSQLPQLDVGGTAPTMGTSQGVATQPRSSGGRLFDILNGVEEPAPAEATQPTPAVDQATLGPTPASRAAALAAPTPENTNAPRFGPFLMEEFNKRAKTLAKDSRSRPNAADPLMLPMFENIAKSLGVQSEGVGASRQVRRPASAVVEGNLGAYLPKFGQLPQEEQTTAVMDALNRSMREPRYRTTPNWEYNYNAQ